MATRLLFALILLAAPAYPLACTSAAAGNWSAPGSWSSCGGGVPGNGDTATIAHAIVVSDNRTVGHSPGAGDATAAILINSPGSVAINSGMELIVRGDLKFASPLAVRDVIKLNAGATLSLDPSLSASRTTAAYIVAPTGTPTGGNSPQIRAACSSGQRCTIRTLRPNGDEARARFSRNGLTAGTGTGNPNFYLEYTDLVDLGTSGTTDASDYAFSSWTPTTYRFENCTFTRVGIVGMSTSVISGSADYRLVRGVFDQSLSTSNTYVNAAGSSITTGTRLIGETYFDKNNMSAGSPGSLVDFTIEYNVFAKKFSVPASGKWISNRWNVYLTNNASSTIAAAGDISDCFVLDDTGGNTRGLSLSPTTYGVIVERCIFQTSGTGMGGDLIVSATNPGNAITHTIRNNLGLPSTGDATKSSGTLLSTGAAVSPPNHVFENNTFLGGTTTSYDYGPFTSEGAPARANTVISYKGNLYWGLASHSPKGMHLIAQNATLNDNIVDPAVCDYNAAYMAGTASWPGKTSNGTKYNIPMMGAVPGPNDLNDVDPQFADPTRGIEKWALSKGGASTVASALLLLRQDPASQIPDLINWVRRGFTPRNLSYARPGAPNSRIGAIDPAPMFGGMNQ